MRRLASAALATSVLWTLQADGQTTVPAAMPAVVQQGAAPEATEPAEWEFSASVYTYVLPGEGNYAQPTFTGDRDWFHVEARFNYEDRDTGSLWVGYNFGGGGELTWQLTPMLGGVFGNTSGVAPGYKGALGWRWIDVYSEGEYVVAGDSADRFFYNWSELTLSPLDWLRAGLVTQRTRAYHSDRQIERGVLVGLTWERLDASLYVFNPDDAAPTVVAAVSWRF